MSVRRRANKNETNDFDNGGVRLPTQAQQGFNAKAIAARLGCTVGTLRVRCSQAQISLRVAKVVKVVPPVPAPKPPKQKRSYAFALSTTLQLSRFAMSRLRQRAEAIGVSDVELVTSLLEVIARDDLYDAVLDAEAKKICAVTKHSPPL